MLRELKNQGNEIVHQKLSRVLFSVLAVVLLLNQAWCQQAALKIGLSKASPNYLNWLKSADPSIVTVDLYKLPVEQAVQELGNCSGLLLTGGEDVFPGRYGKEYDTSRCTEINPHRDSLEFALIEKALGLKMPVIAVCRGLQIINVALGGTLVVDIPADVPSHVVHQCDDYLTCFHEVTVVKNTLLAGICQCDSARVTTNHHQAAGRLSSLLIPAAYSGDRLAEGLEWKEPAGRSFLLAVQWHPERMEAANPLSGPVAREFVRQAALYSSGNK